MKNKVSAKSFLILFVISTLFPLVAGFRIITAADSPLLGTFDVVFAATVFISAAALYYKYYKQTLVLENNSTYINLQKVLSSVVLLGIVLFFLGANVDWPVLLVGLGWRYWLLANVLDYVLVDLKQVV